MKRAPLFLVLFVLACQTQSEPLAPHVDDLALTPGAAGRPDNAALPGMLERSADRGAALRALHVAAVKLSERPQSGRGMLSSAQDAVLLEAHQRYVSRPPPP